MFEKGVSVYVGLVEYNQEDNIKYLKQAKKLGYNLVFSSAHISEAVSETSHLQAIINTTNELGMHLVLDVSKPMFSSFKKPNNVYCYRLDYGFSDEDIVSMTNQLDSYIELNASTITINHLNKLISMGANKNHIRMSFNFYPKRHTGHDIEFVKRVTTFCKIQGIAVSAYVPSKSGLRPPMYEGLPTVESHRLMPLALAIEELKVAGVGGIIFGDSYASLKELKQLDDACCDAVLLPIKVYDGFNDLALFNEPYAIRIDKNSELLRVSSTRTIHRIEPFHTVDRKPMDVTIDNSMFLRYAGELNIVLKNLEADKRVNVIGQVEATPFILNELGDLPIKFIIRR